MALPKLLVGITGSIAATKTIELINLLSNKYEINIICTQEGLKYIDNDSYKVSSSCFQSSSKLIFKSCDVLTFSSDFPSENTPNFFRSSSSILLQTDLQKLDFNVLS